MNQYEYVKNSLELHLFFDRIMNEHSFFLEVSFTEKDNEFKSIARNFRMKFTSFLENAILLANDNLSEEYLSANEIVTKNTLEAENITSNLTKLEIPTYLTEIETNLKIGKLEVNDELLSKIKRLNRNTIPIIENLIEFKNEVLNKVLTCKMYTTNYPLLIKHIINEAKMYHALLSKLESKDRLTNDFLYEQELFWNTIMKEHAEFIRGLLDPSEKDLILTADDFADNYDKLLKQYQSNNNSLTEASLNETLKFRNFKIAGEEGILDCKIKSIIIPLLADHILREANHFIRILKNNKK